MKIRFGFLLLAFLFSTAVLSALTPRQHPLNGVVRSIDVEKHILTLERDQGDAPVELEIVAGRTRLRRDKTPAALTDLVAGQRIHLYYVREGGRVIATEVTWNSSDVDVSSKDKR